MCALPEGQDLLEVVVETQDVDLARDARQMNAVLAQLAVVGELVGLVELLHLEQLLDDAEADLAELFALVLHVEPPLVAAIAPAAAVVVHRDLVALERVHEFDQATVLDILRRAEYVRQLVQVLDDVTLLYGDACQLVDHVLVPLERYVRLMFVEAQLKKR